MKAIKPNARRSRAWIRWLLACCLATVAGWLALAGAPDPAWVAAARSAAAGRAAAPQPPTRPFGPPPLPTDLDRLDAWARDANDPPPYAPGGDDILPADAGNDSPSPWAAAEPPRHAAAPAGRAAPPGAGRAIRAPFATPFSAAPLTAQVWLDRTRAAVGERVGLHVASTGAARCTGEGLFEGELPRNGRFELMAATPGVHTLLLRCSADTGTVTRSATLRVPLPVLPSSALNHSRAATLGLPWLRVAQLGAEVRAALPPVSSDGPLSAGDYFQEGRAALFVATGTEGAYAAWFLAADDAGRWADRSAELLADDDQRRLCARPIQALTADFNRDSRPDVFVSCAACPERTGAENCRSLLYLSQPDGRFRRIAVELPVDVPTVEALDVDGDGLVDLVVRDAGFAATPALWLIGRGDGSFGLAATPATAAGIR